MTSNSTPLPRWDLTEYYSGVNDPNIDLDLAEDMARAKAFEAKYKDRVANLSADELVEALKEMEAMGERPRDPGYYANMMKVIRQNDEAVSALNARIEEAEAEQGSHLIFWGLELKALDPEKLKAMYEQSETLAHYRPYISRVLKYKPHTLSNEVEMALQKRSPVDVSGVLNRLYDETTEKLRYAFPVSLLEEADRAVVTERGDVKEQEGIAMLTDPEVRKYLNGPNEAARKAAFEGWIRGFNADPYLPAFIMNHQALDKKIEDKERGYDRADASRNLGNDIEEHVVDALSDAVKQNYPQFGHRMAALKAKAFGTEKLAAWNEFGPFPHEGAHTTFTWDEARDLVLESFREFSPRMAEIAQMFFDKGWIDAAPRVGKEGGAFSASNRKSSHPFVMMNYFGTPEDVMTLAHELGHGVHQYLASQKQGDLMDRTSLTFAETASTFAEMVVFKKLLSQVATDSDRQALLVEKLGAASAVVERQIAYHDFENSVHEARKNGEISAAQYGQFWLDAHAKRTGGHVEKHPEDAGHRWGGIPHFFHSPFYVYSYAFGDLLAATLYQKFEEMKAQGKGAEFETNYLDLLAAASTEHHSEMLSKRFGADFDATKPEFWQRGLNVYNGMVDELEQLLANEKAATQVADVAHEGTACALPEKGVA